MEFSRRLTEDVMHSRRFLRNYKRTVIRDYWTEEELEHGAHSNRPIYTAIGPITTTRPRIVDHSLANHYRGMRKRCGHSNVFNKHVMNHFYSFVDRYVHQHYTPIPHYELTHEFLDTWLDHSHYTLLEKQSLHRCLDIMNEPTFKFNQVYKINSFIKREFYEEIKEPRIINSPTPFMKVLTGPYIHQLEDQVYDEHFIKHCNPQQVAERMQRISHGYPVVYETDYSSFEGTFTQQLMSSCELILFKHLLRYNTRIYNIIRNVDIKSRKIYFRHKHVADLTGSRLSGCLWTSLANGFTNKMVVEFMAHHVGRSTRRTKKNRVRGFNYDYLVEGDDGFIASDVALPTELAAQLGLKLKCEAATDMNGLSFCGLCVGPSGLVPDFWRTIHKFGYTTDDYLIKCLNSKHWVKRSREMIRAKAMSLLATSVAVPILQPLAEKLMQLTEGAHIRYADFDYWERDCLQVHKCRLQPQPIRMEDRIFFEQRFGIPPQKQIELEELIQTMEQPCVILPL